MAADPAPAPPRSLVILGAGYAGLTVAQQVHRLSRGKIPIVLVDRSPAHILRTQLYEIDRIAASGGNLRRWAVPLASVLEKTRVQVRTAGVERVDLAAHTVQLDSGTIEFGALALCLGSVAAYYGVPGAAEHTHSVYRLSTAQRLATAIREMEIASIALPGERRPRVLVVGGGSTGTEIAAEIASTDWAAVTKPGARRPDVLLLTGSLPFLVGFPPPLIEHARELLVRAGVSICYGWNVTRVEPDRLHLEDGSVLRFDIAVWCAGLQAPPTVAELPVRHGRGGRILVEPTLEIPGHPGLFAVGDVIEFQDPKTGQLVPATAQAALSEARVAAANIVARWNGTELQAFSYRERGAAVSIGHGAGAAALDRLTLWGSPAALLKRLVQRDYSHAVEQGETRRVL
jgi:NADH dehydrogenase